MENKHIENDNIGNKFEYQLDVFSITLNEEQKNQFKKYYELLAEWNQVMNLTAITERGEVYEKHFVDSLAIVNVMDMSKVNNLIDIGTGAGFPGIPLKIVFPHLKVTLLDSLQKRVRFLDHAISELKLENIFTLHGRAEDYARKEKYREKYDLCVSRAVSNLASLSEYCLPYVRLNGMFVAYKSGNIDEEVKKSLNAVRMLGGKTPKVEKMSLPGSNISRALINVKKEKNTSNKYPRKAGIPTKEPL